MKKACPGAGSLVFIAVCDSIMGVSEHSHSNSLCPVLLAFDLLVSPIGKGVP